MTMTTTIRTVSTSTYFEPVSLSQIFIDITNGAALKRVDDGIARLQSKLDHPSMARHSRRSALISGKLARLQAERRFIARTMSAQLS